MVKEKTEAFETFNFDLEPIRGFPELRWTGKRPFTSTQYFPAQLKEEYGHSVEGWWNKIFWGDNLQVMSHLLREFRGKVDLIYIDPPFDSEADYKKVVRLKEIRISNDHTAFEEKQYTDIWNNDNYVQYVYERLILMKELLREGGCIFFHCDWHQSHRIRCVLDEVFGPGSCLNEIIWVRSTNPKGSQHEASRLSVFTDTIFAYGNSKNSKIYPERIRVPLTPSELQDKYHRKDEKGSFYDGPIVRNAGMGDRPNLVYEYKGYTPPRSGWRVKQSMLEAIDAAGDLGWTSNGEPYRKLRPEHDRGKPIGNFWGDISPVNSQADERVGYPTQKPLELLERIILLASNPGELVLDCFMGSGTTQLAAMRNGRRFIGADINLGAIETTVLRLNNEIRDERQLLNERALDIPEDEDTPTPTTFFDGYQVYNVNDYDLFRNPVEAKNLIKEAIELHPLAQNAAFDGEKDGFLVKIMPVNRIATRQDLNEVITNLDFKAFARRQDEQPTRPVEKIMLVCMGHEPDLSAHLKLQAKPFDIEVQVIDILRDKSHLHFKRGSEGKLTVNDGELVITGFYPMNLLQKLSMEKVDDWRQLVETVKIDWNYDGAVLSPTIIDNPEGGKLVKGRYVVPKDAGTIRVKVTDLLSESWEASVTNG